MAPNLSQRHKALHKHYNLMLAAIALAALPIEFVLAVGGEYLRSAYREAVVLELIDFAMRRAVAVGNSPTTVTKCFASSFPCK